MGKIIDKLIQAFFVAAFIAIVVTGVVLTYPKYTRARDLENELMSVKMRTEEKSREISVLRENRNRFSKDREFVEALARENRRVSPGEIVFVFDK